MMMMTSNDTRSKPLPWIIQTTVYCAVAFLLPTWAWKPLLIALTDRREPHDSQDMKKIRFSFVRSVSGDLHVLQVTYSTSTILTILALCGKSVDGIGLTDITTQYVLNLFGLETSFDDQTP